MAECKRAWHVYLGFSGIVTYAVSVKHSYRDPVEFTIKCKLKSFLVIRYRVREILDWSAKHEKL